LNTLLRTFYLKNHISVFSKLFLLKENKTSGEWAHSNIDLCASDVCINGLTSKHPPYITSFGEDEYGKVIQPKMFSGLRNGCRIIE
jgi:hypothetical protein